MDRIEWLKWRKQGIGSSDAPVIMDVSPWKTTLQLWEEKLSDKIEDEDSFIKRKGNEIEPKVRALYETIVNEDCKPKLCQMDEFPFMRASLDGFLASECVVIEIKLLGKEDWELAKRGGVPEKYYPQVQHALLVTGAPKAHFLGYLDPEFKGEMKAENLAIVVVEEDEKYQEVLLTNCIKFWDLVEKKKPPLPSDRDFKKVRGFDKLAQHFKRLKVKLNDIESEMEEVRSQLIQAAEGSKHPRCFIGGLKLQQIARVGNVQYNKIPELKGVDLEKYRGKGTLYWKIGD